MSAKATIFRLFRDSSAASATEYGLLIAGIGLALFGASEGLSYGNRLMWNLVVTNVNSATGTSA
ncbi:MAG: Flp family type IVb pilin [Novosphingobium sp.]